MKLIFFLMFLFNANIFQPLANIKWRELTLSPFDDPNQYSPKSDDDNITINQQERRLTDIQTILGFVNEHAKINGWTAAEPVENIILVNESVQNEEIPLFEVKLTEEPIKDTNRVEKYIIFQNSPIGRKDDIFERYRHAHVFFKRRYIDKDMPLLNNYIRDRIIEYKIVHESRKQKMTITLIMDAVQQAIAEVGISGVVYNELTRNELHGQFLINFNNFLRYRGTLYIIDQKYISLLFSGYEDSFQMLFQITSEENVKTRIIANLRLKLANSNVSLRLNDLRMTLNQKIKASCDQNFPDGEVIGETNDHHLFMRYQGSSNVQKKDPTVDIDLSCPYVNSVVGAFQYLWGKFQYFHVFVDLKEFQTEDFIQSNGDLYKTALEKSIIANRDTAILIRKSVAGNKQESALTLAVIEKTVLSAMKSSKLKEEPISADEKLNVEKKLESEGEIEGGHGREYLKRWANRTAKITVNLYKNKNDFLLEISKPDTITKTITSTVIVLPNFNGYDQEKILTKQITDFVPVLKGFFV